MKLILMNLLLSSAIAAGQQLPKKQVFIRNAEKNRVSFGVSCDNRMSWKSVTLKGHENQRFECNEPEAKVWVHINTDLKNKPHQETEKELIDGTRYQLFWNKAKDERKWDLKPL
jgi:hypothetical protein